MSTFNIDDNMRVDSREVARELGLEHRVLKQTIRRYEAKITKAFNPLTLEVSQGKPLPQGGYSQGETYYLLTENQATFIMTLSNNSDQVVEAKMNLVLDYAAKREEVARLKVENAELKQTIKQLQEAHKPAHNGMQASVAIFRVQADMLAKTCVRAVTGCTYEQVMNGVEYQTKYSPEVLAADLLKALTALKNQFINMKLTNSERQLSGLARCEAIVKRACVKAGVTCKLA